MADNRFSSWKEDHLLKGAMQMYVKQGLKREEAIDFFARRAFLNKRWSKDICAISEFVARPKKALFRLKMLKRL